MIIRYTCPIFKAMIYKIFGSLYCLFFLAGCQGNKTPNTQAKQRTEVISAEDSLKLVQTMENFTPENHVSSMEIIFGKPKYDIKTIGILVYDGVNELDVMGPRYVLGQAMGVKTQLIGLKPGNVKTVMGVEIVPNTIIDSITHLDILIIPGGFKGTIEAAYDTRLHDWIKRIDQKSVYTGSICTGGWVLGATGLLKGKKASTNWYREEAFLKKYGAIPAHERYTQDGKYWTSAGVTAGMDMALAMMKDIYGERYAQAIMLDMEYDPAPPLEGGSPEKTGWIVKWMMESMYDAGINPLIDSLEKATKLPPSKPSGQLNKPSKPDAQPLFTNDTDNICGMKVMPDYTDTCHYRGKVYGFCSKYCKNKFTENPMQYLKK
jgi:putative intracellular protease/amidase/YHS domain-containing protein